MTIYGRTCGVDARPRARPLRRPHRHRRLPRSRRRLRPRRRPLLRGLRRPEPARLRRAHASRQVRKDRRTNGAVTKAPSRTDDLHGAGQASRRLAHFGEITDGPRPSARRRCGSRRRGERVATRMEALFEQDVLAPMEDFKDPSQEWRRLFSELLGTFFLVLVACRWWGHEPRVSQTPSAAPPRSQRRR